METIILNKTKIKIKTNKLKSLIKSLSSELKFKGNLSILFCGDKYCKKINKIFLKREKITDVISFPLNEENYLGDILINLRQVKRQAKKYKVSFSEELKRILIHGILHLKGFDHEKDSGQMEKIERKLALKYKL